MWQSPPQALPEGLAPVPPPGLGPGVMGPPGREPVGDGHHTPHAAAEGALPALSAMRLGEEDDYHQKTKPRALGPTLSSACAESH